MTTVVGILAYSDRQAALGILPCSGRQIEAWAEVAGILADSDRRAERAEVAGSLAYLGPQAEVQEAGSLAWSDRRVVGLGLVVVELDLAAVGQRSAE
jgi:hypothetical protein